MKRSVFILLFSIPVFVFAQKGVIVPDIKPQPAAALPEDIKIWAIDDVLVNCNDSSKCYLVKENGISKTVAIEDVFDFSFEEGTKYTVWVKEELKKPPVNAYASLYLYRVTKIVSKKEKSSNDIPVVTREELQTNIAPSPAVVIDTPAPAPANTGSDKPVFYTTKTSPTEETLSNDIAELKKQVRELKKQVEVMQLQLDMQLKLLDKK